MPDDAPTTSAHFSRKFIQSVFPETPFQDNAASFSKPRDVQSFLEVWQGNCFLKTTLLYSPESRLLNPIMKLQKALRAPSGKFHLNDIPTDATPGVKDRDDAEQQMAELQDQIATRQEDLFINDRRSVLVVLQGMDASGKDGAVRKVFSRVNPAGVEVTSFKVPTSLEQHHDFLWRIHAAVPPHGKIGIFNRSHYEDVIVVRVNSEKLLTTEQQADKDLWKWRFKLINGFEEMLTKSGMVVLKFMLHISRDEQLERFKSRQDHPEKNWKLNWGDFEERKHWDRYMECYEDCIGQTSTDYAPWYIIPADKKWYRNYAIATVLADTLNSMKLPPPAVTDPALITTDIDQPRSERD